MSDVPAKLMSCVIKLIPYCFPVAVASSLLGDNDDGDGDGDGDGNQDVKKAIGLLRKRTTLHAFLYISLPSLHDYDVKMSNYKFYGGRKQATTNLFLSL